MILQGKRPYRLAVIASHPIQYQAPLFRVLAAHPEIDLTVLFCSDWGLKIYRDEGFGQELRWDIPLIEGYRSEFLPNVSPRPYVSSFWGLINPSVVQRLRKGKFDVTWVHGWGRLTNWLAMMTAFAAGIPVILRSETTLLPHMPPWKAAIKRAVLSRLFKRVSGFLAIGRYNTKFYEAYRVPKENIFLVPYAVDNDFFFSSAQELLPRKIELKRKLGMPENLPVILFSGKLLDVKRPMDLLMAFAEVSKTSKAMLVYVGDGPLRPQLETYTKKSGIQHVYFMGVKNQTELPQFYAMADIFVLPSGFEPWGLVVNEAMCFGLPVIVTDQVGAGGDLVHQGMNGFVYPVGQVFSLADQLRGLLIDPVKRKTMGHASNQLVQQWSYLEDIQGIITCLQNVLDTNCGQEYVSTR